MTISHASRKQTKTFCKKRKDKVHTSLTVKNNLMTEHKKQNKIKQEDRKRKSHLKVKIKPKLKRGVMNSCRQNQNSSLFLRI